MYKFKEIVNKLGWDDIPTEIAMDAVEHMLNNAHSCIVSSFGDDVEDKDIINSWLEFMTPKAVYLYLVVCDNFTLEDKEYQELAWALRGEVHDLMKGGMPFWEVRIELDL